MAKETETRSKLSRFMEALSEVFPIEQHSYKPMMVSKDRSGAWIAYYVDLRYMMKRFQDAAEEYGYTYSLLCELLGFDDKGAVVRSTLKLFDDDALLISIEDIGFAEPTAPEPPKSAVTDAYRRVLSQLGVGRYLYHLPKIYISGEVSGWSPKWDFNPLEVLEEALKNPSVPTIIRSKRRAEERSGSGGATREPNENQALWLEEHGFEEPDELVNHLKETFGLKSTAKQINTFTRLTSPVEELDDALIKRTLDEKLGSRK